MSPMCLSVDEVDGEELDWQVNGMSICEPYKTPDIYHFENVAIGRMRRDSTLEWRR